ncbi:hypothetical protein R3P38DRAFT_3188871 [Favolaschia claudopus]|uniref:Uncharacterized protein n=1 Tax=Favolaschia claudopus TaxID=2862362 RepID=A0AAW0BTX3_9AGAR
MTLAFFHFLPHPLAVMDFESDSEEAITDLSSNILLGQSLTTTLNVSGGIGGKGGRGGQDGGAGGNGEGPTFNFSRAEGWIVHLNDGSALRNSETPGSARNSAPPELSICDINLQREVYLNDSRVCFRTRNVVRRYHSAEVKDRREMTVVFYEGQDAEATNEFKAASDYLEGRFGSRLGRRGYTLFLRPSTGRLTIELEETGLDSLDSPVPGTENISPVSLLSSIETRIIIESLTLEQYHKICQAEFGYLIEMNIPPTTTVHCGAVYHIAGRHNAGGIIIGDLIGNPLAICPVLETSSFSSHRVLGPDWLVSSSGDLGPRLHLTETGWNRFHVSELVDGAEYTFRLFVVLHDGDSSPAWLSQANFIFNCLSVFSNADSYALLDEVDFKVQLKPHSTKPAAWHPSNGYLFLCPPESLQIAHASFKLPEHIGYFSLDSSGLDRLSMEQAAEFGFPTLSISVWGAGSYWRDTFYAGLRQFHQGKGFDPNSQDVARHLNLPLYQLYSDYEKSLNVDGSEAHTEELPSSDTDYLGEEDKPGKLDTSMVEDEQRADLYEDSETMVVSSFMKMLVLIQLSLILLIAVLDLCDSL